MLKATTEKIWGLEKEEKQKQRPSEHQLQAEEMQEQF
jgi:hypothetical protein